MRALFGRSWLGLAALLLSGCISSGNEVLKSQDTATVQQNVVDGKTTRDQILSMYGTPNRTAIGSNNKEIWTYTWAHRRPQGQNYIPIVGAFVGGVDLQQKTLIVQFDDNHVVMKHLVSEYNNSVKRDYGSTPPVASPSPSASPTGGSPAPSTPAAKVQAPPPPPPPAPVSLTPATAPGGPEVSCIRSDGMRMRVPGTACPAGSTLAQ
jgi:outer membrane protein assembly factor BamE (lipoprotein component of BamABCDE complex)